MTEGWNPMNALFSTKNAEEVNKVYDKWVSTYDSDIMSKHGFDSSKDNLAKKTVALLQKNDDSTLVLDLAAGTGIIAERLRFHGYKGIVDAVELNAPMLEKAKEKGLYRKYIIFKITPEETIPVENGVYDVVTLGGAFIPNHLEPGCVKPVVRCLKPGGVVIFYSIKLKGREQYVADIENVLSELEKSGEISTIDEKEMKSSDTKTAMVVDDELIDHSVKFFVYRKL